jgi:hypothetical protein
MVDRFAIETVQFLTVPHVTHLPLAHVTPSWFVQPDPEATYACAKGGLGDSAATRMIVTLRPSIERRKEA